MSAARRSAAPFAATGTTPPDPASVWTEIELVDEDGLPVASEPYVVTTDDGRRIQGSLDADGHARIEGPKPGSYRVDFPRMDGRSWG